MKMFFLLEATTEARKTFVVVNNFLIYDMGWLTFFWSVIIFELVSKCAFIGSQAKLTVF